MGNGINSKDLVLAAPKVRAGTWSEEETEGEHNNEMVSTHVEDVTLWRTKKIKHGVSNIIYLSGFLVWQLKYWRLNMSSLKGLNKMHRVGVWHLLYLHKHGFTHSSRKKSPTLCPYAYLQDISTSFQSSSSQVVLHISSISLTWEIAGNAHITPQTQTHGLRKPVVLMSFPDDSNVCWFQASG